MIAFILARTGDRVYTTDALDRENEIAKSLIAYSMARSLAVEHHASIIIRWDIDDDEPDTLVTLEESQS